MDKMWKNRKNAQYAGNLDSTFLQGLTLTLVVYEDFAILTLKEYFAGLDFIDSTSTFIMKVLQNQTENTNNIALYLNQFWAKHI